MTRTGRFQSRFLPNASDWRKNVMKLLKIVKSVCFDGAVRYIIDNMVFCKLLFTITVNIRTLFFSLKYWCLVIILERENQSLRNLFFYCSQKFLLRNTKSRDLLKSSEIVHLITLFFSYWKKFQKSSKQNCFTKQNWFICTIWHVWSNLLWSHAYWTLELCHKQGRKAFSVIASRRFWKVKWVIQTKMQIVVKAICSEKTFQNPKIVIFESSWCKCKTRFYDDSKLRFLHLGSSADLSLMNPKLLFSFLGCYRDETGSDFLRKHEKFQFRKSNSEICPTWSERLWSSKDQNLFFRKNEKMSFLVELLPETTKKTLEKRKFWSN